MKYFYVYILYSRKLDKYYIGQTNDLGDRFIRHNQGRSKSTKGGRHWLLVYAKQFRTRSDAAKFEYHIKKQKSRSYIEKLIKEFYSA